MQQTTLPPRLRDRGVMNIDRKLDNQIFTFVFSQTGFNVIRTCNLSSRPGNISELGVQENGKCHKTNEEKKHLKREKLLHRQHFSELNQDYVDILTHVKKVVL